jgi:hypothetical protein
MTWGEAFPTSAGLAGVGSTSPARGRPVADITAVLAAFVYDFIQVTSCVLRSLSVFLLGLERFSYGRGRSRPLF